MTNIKSKSWYMILLLTTGHFLSDFYNNFLPPLIPLVMSSLGLSLTASGVLVMIYSFTSNILQPVCGYYVDKSGYTWLLLITIPVSAVFICLSGLSPNWLALYLFVALSGLASSLFHPLGSSLVGKVTTTATKGLAMSVFIGGGNLGFALAPAIITYFLAIYGPNYLPWLIGPALVLTATYFFAGLHKIDLTVHRHSNTPINTSAWYKSVRLLRLNLVMALRSWAQVALTTFLPVLLATKGHSPTIAGGMLTVFLLGGTLGGFIGGYAGDKFGHKCCVMWSLIISLPALFFFYNSTEISLPIWILLVISGAGLQSTVPSSIVWAQEILPDNAAMASGMMLGLSFGLGGAGTALTGALADAIGLEPALFATLLPLALSIPLAYLIPDTEQCAIHSESTTPDIK